MKSLPCDMALDLKKILELFLADLFQEKKNPQTTQCSLGMPKPANSNDIWYSPHCQKIF